MSYANLHKVDIKAKVEQLLSKMTLAQKVGQMTQAERLTCSPAQLKQYHLGSILSGGGSCPGDNTVQDWVNTNDEYWAASMEQDQDHLAIPLLYGVDAIHGNNNVRGATVFPHNIGLGASHDVDLLQRIAQVTAKEVLATGVEWTFAPTLAVAQNNCWGRTYESYSQYPEIISQYAKAFVNGLQANLDDNSVIACAKHWVGDGGTTNGIDQGETTLPELDLRNTHITPYYQALDAGVLTIMASFNSWNSEKCHGHYYLLTEVLKGEMGFEGFIVSDWDGIDYLAKDYFDTVALGVNAGIDMFMVPENWQLFIEHLIKHVELGNVDISRIDDAVRRILTVKYAYGLFDKPRPAERKHANSESFGSAEHRAVAQEAVRKSLVLLKNDNDVLPLSKHANVLVAGKNANNTGHQCGGFTIDWQGVDSNEKIEGGSSIWQGIKVLAPHAELSTDPLAIEADASKHDVAIVVIGETPYAEGMGDIRQNDDVIIEAGSQIKGQLKVLEAYGKSLELSQLHPEDLALIESIHAKKIPIVVVLISGRTLVINPELAISDAFVAAWLPGSEGQGIADVLFGDYNFHGKLSFSWPKTNKQAMSSRHQTCDADYLFPHGFGLKY